MTTRPSPRRIALFALGVAVLTLAFCYGVIEAARAHGDYAWINDGAYKAADGSHCCGQADCIEVKPADIAEAPGGAATPFGMVDRRAVYQSRDGRAWVCRRHHRGATPRTSCAFKPGGS